MDDATYSSGGGNSSAPVNLGTGFQAGCAFIFSVQSPVTVVIVCTCTRMVVINACTAGFQAGCAFIFSVQSPETVVIVWSNINQELDFTGFSSLEIFPLSLFLLLFTKK
ncbi:hypothetical protein ABVT39_012615 [Epinephelus coioides]